MTCRIVVLASGNGSLFNALIDARDDELSIEALVTDNPKAGAVAIASRAEIGRAHV